MSGHQFIVERETMAIEVTKANGYVTVVNNSSRGVGFVIELTEVEARHLAAQLLDETRVDVDPLRARAIRAKSRSLIERELWSLISTLLDEIEALRAKVRGDIAW